MSRQRITEGGGEVEGGGGMWMAGANDAAVSPATPEECIQLLSLLVLVVAVVAQAEGGEENVSAL